MPEPESGAGNLRGPAIVNPHPEQLPGPRLLHHFALQQHAQHVPDHDAIDFMSSDRSRSRLSFLELDTRSTELARRLARSFGHHGLCSSHRIVVPVYMPQSIELYIALLGILKAGAAFCPQALDAPPDRLKFVFGDVEAKIVVTTRSLCDSIPKIDGLETVCIEDCSVHDQNADASIDLRQPDPRDAAYVLYTSGSTGTPKGVVLSHNAVTQSLLAHDAVIPPFSRFLQFASPTFDVSMFEIFFTLFRGATLVACDRKTLLNDLTGVLNDMDVDGAELTPTVAGSLLQSRSHVPSLRTLLTIGEMLTRQVVDEFGAADDKPGMLQGMYGPTEAAIHCTLQTTFKAASPTGIIGVPLSTVSAFVIATTADCGDDPTKIKILQVGEVGELAIGGHQLADGYLNRPEQTQAAFISTDDYGILYRTGDKARLLEDGTLECLGRISSGQVKLRGMRMELGEIEHAASTAKGCRVVVASVLRQNLVVFCLADASTTTSSILEACRKWLPSYMLPNDIVLRKDLPQLPSGKIDRKKLEAQYIEEQSEDVDSSEEELDEEEKVAAEVLREILNVQIGLSSNLSHSGLDSLLAIQVASGLRKRGYSVGAVDVLAASTLRQLGKTLRKVAEQPSNVSGSNKFGSLQAVVLEDPSLKQVQSRIQRVLPCTSLQASLLAETRQDPRAYCNSLHIGFAKTLSLEQIRDAVVALMRQNEMLRTGFLASSESATGFVQIIYDEERHLNVTISSEVSQDFELHTENDFLQPVRVQIFEQDDEPRALIHLHHSLYDGWSIDLLLQDLNVLLSSEMEQAPVRPQFGLVAEYYDSLATTSSQSESEVFWKSMLKGFQPTSLPDLSISADDESTTSVVQTSMPLDSQKAVAGLAPNIHPQNLFQAALSHLLSCYMGTSDIVFGTVTSGRTIPVTGIEDVIGPCIATLPLRAAVDQDTACGSLVKSLASSTRAMLPHCTLPLQQIKSYSNAQPGETFFDVLFIWQESLQSRQSQESVARMIAAEDNLEFKLVLEVEPQSSGVDIKLSFGQSSWPQHQAELFLEQLKAVAGQMLKDSRQTFSQLNSNLPQQLLASPDDIESAARRGLLADISESDAAKVSLVQRGSNSFVPVLRGAVGELSYGTGNDASKASVDSDERGDALKSTGQLARVLADSSVQLVDSMDMAQQPHVTDTDLDDIAHAMQDSAHVQVSTVIQVPSTESSQSLVAFWVPKNSASEELEAIQLSSAIKSVTGRILDLLHVKLPPHLVPKALIPVAMLPADNITAVLRSLYAGLEPSYLESFSDGQVGEGDNDEWSDTELTLSAVVTKIARVSSSEVQLRTSFFHLGFNSITAISLARALKAELKCEVETADVLRYPSVSRLAAYLDSKRSPSVCQKLDLDTIFDAEFQETVKEALEKNGGKLQKIRPCTPNQEALLSARASSDSSPYQNHTLFTLKRGIAEIEKAFNVMFKRHEILRTCFFATNDRQFSFAQAVLADFQPPVEKTPNDISKLMTRSIEAVDTAKPPVVITFETSKKPRMLLSMHHALYDKQAIDVLLHEIEQTCLGEKLSDTSSFDEFLAAALTIDQETTDKFWARQLDGYISAPLLDLGSVSPDKTNHSSAHALDISYGNLEETARRLETTPLSILQASWAKTLCFLVDETDICFGNAVSGRTVDVDNVDRLVSPCFNTLPVRVNMAKSDSIEKILEKLHQSNSEALRHQFSPLRRIQARWSDSGERLVDSMFLLQSPERPLNEDVWTMEAEVGDMGFPLICEILPDAASGKLAFNLHYSSDVLTAELAEQVTVLMQHQLRHIGFDGAKVDADALAPKLLECVRKAKQKALDQLQPQLENTPNEFRKLSPSGLTSKSAILRHAQKGQENSTAHDANNGDAEQYDQVELIIRKVLSELSQVPIEQVTKSKTIFQLGLDSISAIQIAKLLRSHDFHVNAEDVLAHPTTKELRQVLQGAGAGARNKEQPSFDFDQFDRLCQTTIIPKLSQPLRNYKHIIPSTAVQSGITAQFLHSDGGLYFNQFVFELDVHVDIATLSSAWKTIAQRYEMLRTGFIESGLSEYPFLAVCYNEIFAAWLDLEEIDVDSTDSAHKTALQAVVKDIREPCWRVQICRTKDRRYMSFSALHSIFDAKVLSILFANLQRAYNGEKFESDRLEVKPLAGHLLAAAENRDDASKKFWSAQLERASSCKFPNLSLVKKAGKSLQRTNSTCSRSLEDVRGACKQLGVSLQAAMQAAFTVLLACYTGDAGVTFGIVLSGRDDESAENTVFPTAVTLPFYAEWYDDPRRLLKQIMDFNGAVRKHQFTPLTDIQRWLDIGNASLFDCLLVLQEPAQFDNKHFKLVDEKGTAEYAISLEVLPHGNDKLGYSLVFWDDVLPKQQSGVLLEQFDHCLLELLSLDSAPVRNSLQSIQPPQESLLDTDVTFMHEFAERTVKAQPNEPALEFNWALQPKRRYKTWTYAELEEQSNKVANHLLSLKIKAGSLVAICFDKCAEASFATFGILKAGSGFVAIDQGAPIARKSFIAKDSNAAAVLTMSSLAKDLRDSVDIPIVALDELEFSSLSADKPTIKDKIDGDSVCYCLYTSGSTGTPKGCLITHHNAVQGLLAFKHIFKGRYTHQSRWLQFASFHFDVSVLEQFWSWMVGICMISAPRDLLFEDLPGALSALEVTHLDLTPSLARLITPEQVPSLCQGVFITGGEQLRQEVLDAWGETRVIHNFYGPSECTIGVTVNQGVNTDGKPSNIGRQFINVGTCVLKADTEEPVFSGAPGELCLYGPLVGKGYLNRPDLTQERFPYISRFGERVYRTGDLVRVLHDGSFDFIGRIDDQVKLRGQRLELGEISSAARGSSSSIKDSHTLVIKDAKRQTEQIVTFLVLDDSQNHETNKESLENSVMEGCKNKLPPYMVPSSLFWVDRAFPLTPNNKADAKALRATYERSGAAAKASHSGDMQPNAGEALTSREELAVARVLAEYLKLDPGQLNTSTNIFQAGLDSISVFNFVRALRDQGFNNASTHAVMQSGCISDLAKTLSSSSQTEDGAYLEAKQTITAFQQRYRMHAARALELDFSIIETVYPCTPLQQGMIARSLDKSAKTGLYLNTFEFQLNHDIDQKGLQSAWEQLIEAIPILRTRFVQGHEGHIQAVLVPDSNVVAEVFWSGRASPLSKPFMITLDKDVMVLSIHHALYDAISLQLLLDRLQQEYTGQGTLGYGPSFFKALPYGPLKKSPGAKSFWVEHLKQSRLTPLDMPFEPESECSETHIASQRLSNLDQLEPIRRKLGVTHQAIVQSCWAVALQEFLKAATTTGLVVSGRSIDFTDADQIIGPMFNTLPFYAGLEQEDTFISVARKCHQYNLNALSHQHTALFDISKWVRQPGRSKMFDNLFVFQKTSPREEEGHTAPWTMRKSSAVADYPLAFEAEQIDDGTLDVQVVAQASALSAEAVKHLLESFEKLLSRLLVDPDQHLKEVLGTDFIKTCSTGASQESTDVTQESKGTVTDWSKAERHELLIAEELASVSGTELKFVSPQTSILEIGLDSIDAIKLSSRVKNKGYNLPMSTIMQARTVSGIAEHLRQSADTDEDAPDTGKVQHEIDPRLHKYVENCVEDGSHIEKILRVTPLQEAMIAEMQASSYESYFNNDLLLLEDGTNLQKLESAWETVVQGSPILRTSFLEVDDPDIDDSFVQIVNKTNTTFWTSMNMPDQGDDKKTLEQYTHHHRKVAQFSKQSPPFYVTAVQVHNKSYLVLSIAHALYDGFSLGLIHQDVHKAYQNSFVERPSYDTALESIIEASGSEAELFWTDFLQGAHPSEFPQPGRPGRLHRQEIKSSLSTEGMHTFCKQRAITPQALAYSCWSVVLASHTSSLETISGLVLSGREDETSQELMFPMMNTVAVRLVIHGTVTEMLEYSQSTLADVAQHQHYPLRKMQTVANRRQLFDSLFIFQRRPTDEESSGVKIYESEGGESNIEYPVAVELEILGDSVVWRAACSSACFSKSETEDLLKSLDRVLRYMTENPEAQLIDYQQSGVSLCELPTFKPFADVDSTPSPLGSDEGYASDRASLTPEETALCEVLSTVAKIDVSDISKKHTLFHLGLDSISAIKVSSLLRLQKGYRIGVSTMLQAGTIEKIAQAIEAAANNSTNTPDSGMGEQSLSQHKFDQTSAEERLKSFGLSMGDVDEILPATAGQIHMLSVWINSGGALMHSTFEFRLKGISSLADAQHAWDKLVQATPMLRTCFLSLQESDGQILQVVLKHSSVSRGKLAPLATANFSAKDGSIVFNLRIHHALYDAVSLQLLLDQLAVLVADTSAVAQWHSNSASLAPFVALVTSKEDYKNQEQFWTKYLDSQKSESAASLAQTHLPRLSVYKPSLFSYADCQKLSATARSKGLSVQSIYLAALSKVYDKARQGSHGKSVLLGIHLANRTTDETASLPAPTLNLLPVLAREPAKTPLFDIAKQIQQDLQKIGTDQAISQTTLWRLKKLTGANIDIFVNFLPLASETDESPSNREVELERLNGQITDGTYENLEKEPPKLSKREETCLAALSGADLTKQYTPYLDVEAAIRPASGLDCGFFGPQDMIGNGIAGEMFTMLVEILREVLETGTD